MKAKRSGSVVCVLPHDSVLSALEGEQRALRSHIAERQRGDGSRDAPFSFLPPFCPYPPQEISGSIEIGPLKAIDGWIVRPVSGCDAGNSIDPPPGYPDLPRIAHFLIGYAGARAEDILDGFLATVPAERAGTIVLRVWRKATVNFDFEVEDAAFSFRYSFTEGVWERSKGQ